MECSAKESRGVDEVFENAINIAIKAEDESYETKPDMKGVKVKKAKKKRCIFM